MTDPATHAASTPESSTPEVGRPAPDFSLRDQHGQDVTLSDAVQDGPALLVFYPFAFSGTCTGELCALRDDLAEFTDADVRVLAVSCDPTYSLKAYAEAEGYSFSLLSDFWPHGAVARQYGVFDEQAGRAGRGSFLVDTGGVVRWSVVNQPGQARDVADYRAAVKAL